MKISLFFFTLSIIGSLSISAQPIIVSGGFEGSNVVDISEVSANNFTCKLKTPPMAAPESNYYNTPGDHYHNWFMLKIENAAGQTVNITITNADWGGGGAGMWGRVDGKAVYTEAADPNALSSDATWQKITDASYSSPNFTFTLTPASNLAWVALSYPALPTHTSNWISALSGNPDVDTEVVTYTSQGLPLQMLFVTNTSYPAGSKKTVLIYGQEHGNEQTSALTCQGLVDFLVSGDAIAENLLQNMIFIVFPDICPNATYAGLTTDPNTGLGPEWRNNPAAVERMMPGMSVPMTLESKAIWNRLDQFANSGNLIDFALNIHQGGIDNWFGVYELADPVADNFDGFLRTKMPSSGASWVPNNAQGYSRGGWQDAVPYGWPIIRILGRCWEEWRTTAMGYEISVGASANNFLNNMSGIKYFGEAIALAFYDYYGSFDKSLTISSPNGGETLSSGGSTNVTWTSAGSPGNVRIDCSTDGGSTWQNLISSTVNDGDEIVSLPTGNSDNCLIRISSATAMGIVDKSNTVFTIGTPPVSTISVTYPNGGETLDANYFEAVTWTSTGTVTKVNIEISIDGGTTWKRAAYAVTNNNSYLINIPGSTSAQCLIKVTNAENLSISDVSDSFLSIQSAPAFPSIEVLYPNGGETILPESSITVTWSSIDFSSDVGIRISTDEGANWTTLISSTTNDGNENVTMPSVNSSKCIIWVYEATIDSYVNQPSAFPLDVSDNLFSLGTTTGNILPNISKVNIDNIEVYPNPTTGKIKIKAEGIQKIEVMNITGQTIYKSKYESPKFHTELVEETEVDLSNQSVGIYLIKITTDKQIITKKLIKQ